MKNTKALLGVIFIVFLISGCGGGNENIVQFNNAVATTMQQELDAQGVNAHIDASCRPTGETHICDVFLTASDGKRQRIGDANNVRLTKTGVVWDREQ